MHKACTTHAYRAATVAVALCIGVEEVRAQALPEAGLERALTLCLEALEDPGLEAFAAIDLHESREQQNGALVADGVLKADGTTPQSSEDPLFYLGHFYNAKIEGAAVNTCNVEFSELLQDDQDPVALRLAAWGEAAGFARAPDRPTVKLLRCVDGDLSSVAWIRPTQGLLVQMFHLVDEPSCEEG